MLQQGLLAIGCASYIGYVAVDQFAQHEVTAIENAKRRGRLRGEAKVRLREVEDAVAEEAATAAAAAAAAKRK